MRIGLSLLSIFLASSLGASEPQMVQPSALPDRLSLESKSSPPTNPPAAQFSSATVTATAVIAGPRESAPGDLVVLDASGSDAVSFAWALPGSNKTFLPVDGGKRCVFASGASGKYVFVLAVARGDTVAIATHELTIGKPAPEPEPGPTPPPGPTPLPDGKFKLAKLAYDNALKIQSANRKAEAQSMAKAFRSVVAAIAAGTMSTPKQILDGTSAAIESNMGAAREPWKAWGQSMAVEYQRLYEAKQLPSPADWKAAWEEVALGLEAIQ